MRRVTIPAVDLVAVDLKLHSISVPIDTTEGPVGVLVTIMSVASSGEGRELVEVILLGMSPNPDAFLDLLDGFRNKLMSTQTSIDPFGSDGYQSSRCLLTNKRAKKRKLSGSLREREE